jgi:hypothetical protein
MTDAEMELIAKLKALAAELGRKPTRDEFRGYIGNGSTRFGSFSFNQLCRLAGLDLHPNQRLTRFDPSPPKILLLDIETAPIELWSYGIREQYHSTSSIEHDWTLLSFAAKWLDSKQVIYHSVKPEAPRDDRLLTHEAYRLLNEADVVIVHNAKFDIGKLRSRFLFYDFPDNRPYRTVCTYRVAKKHFPGLSSHKLEYLAKYLGVIEKLDHSKFPGIELFKQCAKGNMEAFKVLKDYNVRDVITLEACYLRLRKYDKTIRWNVFIQDNACHCGSREFRNLEPIVTNTGAFKTKQCVSCGAVFREKENLIDSTIRKHLLL